MTGGQLTVTFLPAVDRHLPTGLVPETTAVRVGLVVEIPVQTEAVIVSVLKGKDPNARILAVRFHGGTVPEASEAAGKEQTPETAKERRTESATRTETGMEIETARKEIGTGSENATGTGRKTATGIESETAVTDIDGMIETGKTALGVQMPEIRVLLTCRRDRSLIHATALVPPTVRMV